MAYLHSAFIENTQEARKWLESLGYSDANGYKRKDDIIMPFMCCDTGSPHFTSCENKYLLMHIKDDIDCRGSLPLFKAVTALQDDNDYMQWFTDGYHWECCPDESADVEAWMARYTPLGEKDSIPHKATLEELIEHFKTK